MKAFLRGHCLAVFALAWLLSGWRADGQGFGIVVSNIPSAVAVNGTLNYSFSVTNETGVTLTDFEVTNVFSSGVVLLSITNDHAADLSFILTNGNSIIYAFDVFTNADTVNFSYSVQPTATGLFTNSITAATVALTNTATTNLITQVFNSASDLGVTVLPPVQAVVTNDITSYSVVYTNQGPQAAAGVFLTNIFPPGVTLKSVSPTSPSFSLSGSNMVFSLGTVNAGSGGSFVFTIIPTNVEVATLSASIGAANVLDANTNNNTAVTNLTVTGYLAGLLIAFTNSAQTLDVQNGFIEQSIVVSNADVISVPAVRVVITGLTNQLFNATGTNGGNPYVYLSAPLSAGQSAGMLLQYVSPTRSPFPFTNGQLHAFAVPLPVWTPPVATATSTNINVRRITQMANADILLEFPATAGQTYSIIYSDNILFSNAMIAPPAITAQGNEVQWIDYGPPTTVSPPAGSSARFYRIIQNP